MANNRLELRRIQEREHGTRKDDVAFALHEIERGVWLRNVLRLIERHWDVQLKASLGVLNALVEFRMSLCVQTVSGFKQLEPQVLGIIGLCASRSEPIPQLTLLRFEVIPQLEVEGQRFKIVFERGHTKCPD